MGTVAAHAWNFSSGDASPVQKRSAIAIRAHGAPLVMVALEPDFIEICEAAVLSDFLRGQMRVEIENWLRRGVFVIEMSCGFGFEKKIVVNEGHVF